MDRYPDHQENLISLRRIEGQIRGIQNMIEKRTYCVDILIQVHAAISALARIEDKILEKHFQGCVTHAVNGKSQTDKKKKLKEIMLLIKKFRKL